MLGLDPSQIFTQVLNWLCALVLDCFDSVFALIAKGLMVTPDVTALPQVQALTGRSVWVVDTLFVLAFLAAGVLTMTTGGQERARYTVKDLAPRLVVGFIAAHFCPLLASKAITVANGLTDALTPGDPNRSGALDAIGAHVHAARDSSAALLFLVITVLITTLLAVTMLGMLVRVAVLLILCTAAPLALACHALPQTDPAARLWWRAFFGCLAVPVLQAFTLQAGQWMLEDPSHLLPELGLPADPGSVINLFVVLVLLWTTARIPGLVAQHVTHGPQARNLIATMVRVVIVQQLTRGLRRSAGSGTRGGVGRGGRVVTR